MCCPGDIRNKFQGKFELGNLFHTNEPNVIFTYSPIIKQMTSISSHLTPCHLQYRVICLRPWHLNIESVWEWQVRMEFLFYMKILFKCRLYRKIIANNATNRSRILSDALKDRMSCWNCHRQKLFITLFYLHFLLALFLQFSCYFFYLIQILWFLIVGQFVDWNNFSQIKSLIIYRNKYTNSSLNHIFPGYG